MSERYDYLTDGALWDAYNTLLLGPDTTRVRKLLARYELFKQALRVPGDIVECGVFRGAGALYWLKLLSIFDPGGTRRVVGFDTFTGFASVELDPARERPEVYGELEFAGFEGVSADTIFGYAEAAGLADRLDLDAGDISQTAASWAHERPGSRIALLHLDLDTYHGTSSALDALYPRVVRDGLVVFDEYGVPQFGESDAVDAFLAAHPGLELRSVASSATPTAYLIKP